MFSSNTTRYTVPTLSYITALTNINALPTYTFTDASIGGPGRIIVGIVSENNVSTSNQITSVTFNSVNADYLTSFVGAAFGSSVITCGLASIRVTSGTTSTIVITFPNSQVRAAIMIWRLVNNQYETPIIINNTMTGNTAAGATVSVTNSNVHPYPNAQGLVVYGHGDGADAVAFSAIPSTLNIIERADGRPGTADTRYAGAQFTVPYFTSPTSAIITASPAAAISQGIILVSSVWL